MEVQGRPVRLFPARAAGAPLVLLMANGDEGALVCEQARTMAKVDFTLAAVGGFIWNDDLTPWPAPALRRGGAPFGGRAADWLEALIQEVLPGIGRALPCPPGPAMLAGYSLAGLFAVYALFNIDRFTRAASASGSMWYPGFADYVEAHVPPRLPERVCLSLGDREAQTRDPVMRAVEADTRRVTSRLCALGVDASLEMVPGGHFHQPDVRMARAIARMVAP